MTYKKLVFKDNCIDFIRLIAAMIVMFSHSFRWFGVDKPIWGLYFTDGSVGVISLMSYLDFLSFLVGKVQFTVSSGLHSVLERPFSEANGHPFFVKKSLLSVC